MKQKFKILLMATGLFIGGLTKAQWTSGTGVVYPTTITDKVGIGTNAPVYRLDVMDLISAGSIGSGGNFLVGLNTDGVAAVGNQSVNKHAIFGSLGTNKDILFPTYNGSSFDERMRITSAGNVGIGATNPQRRLVVSNNGAEGVELQHFSGYGQVIAYNRVHLLIFH